MIYPERLPNETINAYSIFKFWLDNNYDDELTKDEFSISSHTLSDYKKRNAWVERRNKHLVASQNILDATQIISDKHYFLRDSSKEFLDIKQKIYGMILQEEDPKNVNMLVKAYTGIIRELRLNLGLPLSTKSEVVDNSNLSETYVLNPDE